MTDRLEVKAEVAIDDAGTVTGIAWPFAFHYENREAAAAFGASMQIAPYGVTAIADAYRTRWFGEAHG